MPPSLDQILTNACDFPSLLLYAPSPSSLILSFAII